MHNSSEFAKSAFFQTSEHLLQIDLGYFDFEERHMAGSTRVLSAPSSSKGLLADFWIISSQ